MVKIKTLSALKGVTFTHLQILLCETTCSPPGVNGASCLAGATGTLRKVNIKHSGATTRGSCVVCNLPSGPDVPESSRQGVPQTFPRKPRASGCRPTSRETPTLSQEVTQGLGAAEGEGETEVLAPVPDPPYLRPPSCCVMGRQHAALPTTVLVYVHCPSLVIISGAPFPSRRHPIWVINYIHPTL